MDDIVDGPRPEHTHQRRSDRMHHHVGPRREKLDVGSYAVHGIDELCRHRFDGFSRKTVEGRRRVGPARHQLSHVLVQPGRHGEVSVAVDDHLVVDIHNGTAIPR